MRVKIAPLCSRLSACVHAQAGGKGASHGLAALFSNRLLLYVLLGFFSLLLWPRLSPALLLTLLAGGLLCLLVTALRPAGFVLLAAAWAAASGYQQIHRLPADYLHKTIAIQAYVLDIPQYHDELTRMRLSIVSPRELRGQLLVGNWYRSGLQTEELPRSGERWSFSAKLRPPYGAVNRFGFDYARWLLGNGVSATASVSQGVLLQRAKPSVAALRDDIAVWISNTLTGPALTGQTAALARALAVGDRSLLDESSRARLAATGTSHLLAISGLHIGLVALLGGLALRGLTTLLLLLPIPLLHRYIQVLPWHKLTLAGGLLLAGMYALLSGFMLSTQRALIMLVIAALALLLRRQQLSGRSLLLAAVMIVAVNPVQVLSAGFWLSFSAVFTLWLVFAGRTRNAGKLRSLLIAQLALTSVMLMVQVAVMQQFSLLMMPVNLLAIPYVSVVVMPPLLLALILHLAGVAGADGLLLFTGQMLAWLQQVLSWFEPQPGQQWSWSVPIYADRLWLLLIAMFGGIWLVLPRGVPLRWLGLMLWLPVLWPLSEQPAPGHWQAEIVDTGQGTAVAVRTAGHVLVYDTGPGDNHGRDRVAGSMLPLLQSWRMELDRIIVSHGDLDHAGGLHSLRERWPAADTISSDTRFGRACEAGMHWRWDGVDFTILHPGKYLPYMKNNSSCVLLVASTHGRLLLPGDIDEIVERRLLAQWHGPAADVLLVPHHGSASSSSNAWLTAVAPHTAIVSAGMWNRFEFPRQQVVERYQQHSIRLLNTATCGAVAVRSQAGRRPRITSRRLQRPRWWQNITRLEC